MNAGRSLAVLDTNQIDRLAVELDSRSCALGVVSRFLERLPERLHAIQRSLHQGKSDCALSGILSVATSAAMAGAPRLERQSRCVEGRIRSGDFEAARAAASCLTDDAAEFAVRLEDFLDSAGPAADPSAQGSARC